VTRVERAGADALACCLEIRRRVFVEEQRVAEADEQDGLDGACLHWLAWRGDRAVGTARLREVEDGWKAERVAVLAEFRNHGVGVALMRALEAEAWRRGAARVWLHAQVPVVSFYERLGYTAEGIPFDEAGIPHLEMSKPRPC
jgi:predicted GNAT family N-acyltransferase